MVLRGLTWSYLSYIHHLSSMTNIRYIFYLSYMNVVPYTFILLIYSLFCYPFSPLSRLYTPLSHFTTFLSRLHYLLSRFIIYLSRFTCSLLARYFLLTCPFLVSFLFLSSPYVRSLSLIYSLFPFSWSGLLFFRFYLRSHKNLVSLGQWWTLYFSPTEAVSLFLSLYLHSHKNRDGSRHLFYFISLIVWPRSHSVLYRHLLVLSLSP